MYLSASLATVRVLWMADRNIHQIYFWKKKTFKLPLVEDIWIFKITILKVVYAFILNMSHVELY